MHSCFKRLIIFTRYLEAEGLERTYKFKQSDIVKAVDISTANKVTCMICRFSAEERSMLL